MTVGRCAAFPRDHVLIWLQTESEKQCWKPVLMMVTEKDLLLYDSLPRGRGAWQSPAHTYPLLATRWVHPPHTHTVMCSLLLLLHDADCVCPGWSTLVPIGGHLTPAQSSSSPLGRALASALRRTCSVPRPPRICLYGPGKLSMDVTRQPR